VPNIRKNASIGVYGNDRVNSIKGQPTAVLASVGLSVMSMLQTWLDIRIFTGSVQQRSSEEPGMVRDGAME